MNVLVIGGTGTVGTALTRRLLERGARVRVMSRDAGGVGVEGSERVRGDLARPDSLPPAMTGVDAVYLLTPLHEREAELGLAAVAAAHAAGIGRLVFQSVHRVEEAGHLPHFRSKIEIAAAVRTAGIPYTLISPNSFFQNEYMYKDAIVGMGVYPQPIGPIGGHRVDVRDIAHAAATVLLESGHEGREYPLVGPEAVSGPESAALWSRHLGREVRYAGDVDAWAENARAHLPARLVEALRDMYAHFTEHGWLASAEELEACRALLGRDPRSYEAFVEETAAAWAA